MGTEIGTKSVRFVSPLGKRDEIKSKISGKVIELTHIFHSIMSLICIVDPLIRQS